MIVTFEGVDRSGKTTLFNAFKKRMNTSNRFIMIDRAYLSFLVYSSLYSRPYMLKEFVDSLPRKLVVVRTTSSIEDIDKRCYETNHEQFDVGLHEYTYDSCDRHLSDLMRRIEGNYLSLIIVTKNINDVENHIDFIIKEIDKWELSLKN